MMSDPMATKEEARYIASMPVLAKPTRVIAPICCSGGGRDKLRLFGLRLLSPARLADARSGIQGTG